MARALIYLSFLSIPGAEELGLLPLTGLYVILILATGVIFTIIRPGTIPLSTFMYLLSIPAFLLANYYFAHYNEVDIKVWLARSIHLMLLPFMYLAFKFSKTSPNVLLRDICICGIFEVLLIYGTFFAYLDTEQLRRAADIEGVIVYSLFLIFGAFFCLKRFEDTRSRRYLLFYSLVLLATILTGSRSLTIATLLLVMTLRNKILFVFLGSSISLIALAFAGNSLIERYDLTNQENLITVLSKLEELIILFNFFLENPLLGAGLGKPYQISIALTEYTYSHNILFFFLGYAGLFGLFVAIYPLLRLFFARGHKLLVIAIFLFYTSSTTYTNFKHSLVLAFALVLIEYKRKNSLKKPTMHIDTNSVTKVAAITNVQGFDDEETKSLLTGPKLARNSTES